MSNGNIVATREAEWIIPAVLLTFGSGIFAIVKSPNHSGILPALMLLPMWMVAAAAMGAVFILFRTAQMMIAGVERPIARWLTLISEQRRQLVFVIVGMLLAGLNMITFMWIKPLLNYLVPFWADPYLASMDYRIFHTEPWRSLSWLNNEFTSIFYHRAWFALIILLLLKVLSSPPRERKMRSGSRFFAVKAWIREQS
jgi:hypothetical protein